MRLSAIGVCAALLLGFCSRNSGYVHRFTYTPPPPAPTSAVPLRHANLRLQTLKGRTVTTGIDLPPALTIGSKEAILETKTLWRVPAARTPAPSKFVPPELTVTNGSLFVSTGTNIERIAVRSGRVLWHSAAATAPFTESAPFIIAAHADAVVALSEQDGRVLWRRTVCPASTRVADVAVDGQTIFGLCANPAKLVALRARSGRVLYARILSKADRGASLRLLGSGTLLAHDVFEGAWMGNNLYLVREHTGTVVLARTNIELFRIRGSTADFIDRCCFEHDQSYEPGKILPVNVLNGDTGSEVTLAPDPARFREESGEGADGPDGTVFTNDGDIYLYYGDTLFRYSSLDARPKELLRGIVRIAYARADAFVAVLDGDPNAVLARIDWTAKHPVLHPIAAIDSAWPSGLHGTYSPAPLSYTVLDDVALAFSASGAVSRLPIHCRLQSGPPDQTAVALCTPASGTGYIEELRFGTER